MPDRIVVFLDAQSVYKDAREAFFHPKDPYSLGQVDPVKFARLISTRKPPGLPEGPRVLAGVRVYAGLPSAAGDTQEGDRGGGYVARRGNPTLV